MARPGRHSPGGDVGDLERHLLVGGANVVDKGPVAIVVVRGGQLEVELGGIAVLLLPALGDALVGVPAVRRVQHEGAGGGDKGEECAVGASARWQLVLRRPGEWYERLPKGELHDTC